MMISYLSVPDLENADAQQMRYKRYDLDSLSAAEFRQTMESLQSADREHSEIHKEINKMISLCIHDCTDHDNEQSEQCN